MNFQVWHDIHVQCPWIHDKGFIVRKWVASFCRKPIRKWLPHVGGAFTCHHKRTQCCGRPWRGSCGRGVSPYYIVVSKRFHSQTPGIVNFVVSSLANVLFNWIHSCNHHPLFVMCLFFCGIVLPLPQSCQAVIGRFVLWATISECSLIHLKRRLGGKNHL